jgi:hypothetical protein
VSANLEHEKLDPVLLFRIQFGSISDLLEGIKNYKSCQFDCVHGTDRDLPERWFRISHNTVYNEQQESIPWVGSKLKV